MAQLNWERILQNPRTAVRILVILVPKLVGKFISRIFSYSTQPVTLRVVAGNLLCSVISSTDHRILLDAPEWAVKSCQSISLSDGRLFILCDQPSLREADVVIIFCHGGGFSAGHPLQYRTTYRRWIDRASQNNLKLAAVAVQYRAYLSLRSGPRLTFL